MKEIASSEKLQGQLIGLNVLIEALLQTLPKQQLRQAIQREAAQTQHPD